MATDRKPIRFEKWKPVARDYHIGYAYTVELAYRNGTVGARRVRPGTDRWMRARAHIAASALARGAEEFDVWGGVGARSWRRKVLVSQEAAEAYLRAAAARDFTMKGALKKALAARDRRLSRPA